MYFGKKIFIICLILIPIAVYGNTFSYIKIGEITFQYVTYDISSEDYNIHVLHSEDAISLENLALSHNSLTAINGVFFCPADYSQCNGKSYTINERFVQGEDLSFYEDTGERGVFGWSEEGTPFIHQTGKINTEKREEIFEGLGNFPILIAEGENMLEHYHDVGLYDNKMRFPTQRHFICSNKENNKIIFGRTSPISLDNLTPLLYDIGCWNALNLDAGNSSHFIYNGKKIAEGPRKILDGFAISHKKIQIKTLEDKLNDMMYIVERQYKRLPKRIAITRLESFLTAIPQLRTKIYDTYSYNVLDNGGNIVGYETEITSISDLERVYMLNGIEKRLEILKQELEN